MQKQQISFDKATDYLINKVSAMKLPEGFVPKYDMVETLRKIRKLFKNKKLRASVLNKKYEESRLKDGLYSAGFCGIASYIWSHLFRMPNGEPIWETYEYKNNHKITGLVNHVWLVNRFTNDVLDLTFDQSVDSDGNIIPIPYELGVPVDADKPLARAYTFDKYLKMDLRDTVIRNKIKSEQLQDETSPKLSKMTKNQTKYFESATRTLLEKIDEMNLNPIQRLNAKNITLHFRDAFHLSHVKIETFYELNIDEIKQLTYDADGFCMASSTNFASLMGGEKTGWQLMYIGNLWTYGPHFYVLHKPSNTVFDLTYDQFHGIPIPYNLGSPVNLDEALQDRRPKAFAKALNFNPMQFYNTKHQKE